MKQYGEIWLPDIDSHFPRYAKKGDYHNGNYHIARKQVTCWDCAIDCGAHVGFWTRLAIRDFETIHAFEPIEENYDCLLRNIAEMEAVGKTVVAHKVALGNGGRCGFTNPKPSNTGAWEGEDGADVTLRKLDDMVFPRVGLIKLDVQNMELDVLRGAERLLLKDKPVVQVETVYAGTRNTLIGGYLKTLGYEFGKKTGKDEIWTST